MKLKNLVVLFLVAALLLSACDPTPVPTPAPVQPPTGGEPAYQPPAPDYGQPAPQWGGGQPSAPAGAPKVWLLNGSPVKANGRPLGNAGPIPCEGKVTVPAPGVVCDYWGAAAAPAYGAAAVAAPALLPALVEGGAVSGAEALSGPMAGVVGVQAVVSAAHADQMSECAQQGGEMVFTPPLSPYAGDNGSWGCVPNENRSLTDHCFEGDPCRVQQRLDALNAMKAQRNNGGMFSRCAIRDTDGAVALIFDGLSFLSTVSPGKKPYQQAGFLYNTAAPDRSTAFASRAYPGHKDDVLQLMDTGRVKRFRVAGPEDINICLQALDFLDQFLAVMP